VRKSHLRWLYYLAMVIVVDVFAGARSGQFNIVILDWYRKLQTKKAVKFDRDHRLSTNGPESSVRGLKSFQHSCIRVFVSLITWFFHSSIPIVLIIIRLRLNLPVLVWLQKGCVGMEPLELYMFLALCHFDTGPGTYINTAVSI
jgi:hypothetical protein